jgi:hypothetical protein
MNGLLKSIHATNLRKIRSARFSYMNLRGRVLDLLSPVLWWPFSTNSLRPLQPKLWSPPDFCKECISNMSNHLPSLCLSKGRCLPEDKRFLHEVLARGWVVPVLHKYRAPAPRMSLFHHTPPPLQRTRPTPPPLPTSQSRFSSVPPYLSSRPLVPIFVSNLHR